MMLRSELEIEIDGDTRLAAGTVKWEIRQRETLTATVLVIVISGPRVCHGYYTDMTIVNKGITFGEH